MMSAAVPPLNLFQRELVRAPASLSTRATPSGVFTIGPGWFPERKGGAENMYYQLHKRLGATGYGMWGVVPGSAAVAADSAGAVTGFSDTLPMSRRLLAVRRALAKASRPTPPDLVASHFALFGLAVLDQLGHAPLVTHFHGPWSLESQMEGRGYIALRRTAEQLVYRRSALVIVLSQAFSHIVQSEYGVSDARVRLVPGGVDCDRFDIQQTREQARAALGWDVGRPTLFTVRRLVKRMGLDRLIEAMAAVRVQPAGRDAVLHIAGTGAERAALEAMAKFRGVADAVRFDGFMPDELMPLAFRAADLTAIPTTALEGFGLVAAESLAAGTPVLATPIGGLPEVVQDLSPTMVLPDAGAGAMADGILAILRQPSLMPNADRCRSFARARYDWNVVTPQIAAVYEEALR